MIDMMIKILLLALLGGIILPPFVVGLYLLVKFEKERLSWRRGNRK